jgi:hypothetical protein
MKHRYTFVSSLALAVTVTLGNAACVAQTGEEGEGPTVDDSEENVETSESALTATSPERAVASRLGLPARFAFGMGNDAESYNPNDVSAYKLGTKADIHYMYLSGLPGEYGWTDWNSPSGEYLTMHANAAKARGVVPMFTLYQAAAWGENNLSAFNNSDFMTKYWRGVRTMFTRLGTFGSPSIVHIEPDLWGYTQQKGEDPWAVPMKVGAIVPECTDLPANVAGFGKCIVRLGRRLAPKAVIGLSASKFGAYTNGVSDPVKIANYLNKVGGAEADITVVETLDRDAGCFEVGTDPNCKRSGRFYWTESDFLDHLAWAKTIREIGGKPLLWWQMPLGVPSSWSGTANKYRDNRVQYTFANAWRFANAGGIGAVFGKGKANQTTALTDGGQFKNSLGKYISSGGNRLR